MRVIQKSRNTLFIQFTEQEKQSIYLGLIIGIFFFLAINVQIGILLGLVASTLYRLLRAENISLNGQPFLTKLYKIKRNKAYCRVCSNICSGPSSASNW